MSARFEIVKSFCFEAAHRLATYPAGHPNTRVHGHSFRVEVAVASSAPRNNGMVEDFASLQSAIADVGRLLDHAYLNDIDGLAQPTLETLAAFIADRLRSGLPALCRVSVFRDSLGEACHLTLT